MHAFPRSSVLILEENRGISSLIPSTLVDQVDALLDAHKIDDAAVLVDQRRIKLEGNLTVDPDEAEELDYAYQVIGFKCFSETLFEDAGRNLFNGKLDPRVLVSYFPDLRGNMFESSDQVDVFAGVVERMPRARSTEELIQLNLVLNYSPHLSPTSPPTLELTRVLNDAAREMLLVFLEKSQRRAKVERRSEDLRVEVARVVDTVLAKLYVHFSRPSALSNLLAPSSSSSDPQNLLVLDELEPLLLSYSLLSPLAQLYKQQQQHEKLLELYASASERSDSASSLSELGLPDPVGGVFDLLSSTGLKRDREVCLKWGLWMLKRGEVDRGMKLLIPPESSKRRDRDREKEKERDLELLEQIMSANETAGRRYLEHLVLVKRHTSPDLHTRLALACIDDLLRWLQDEATLKLWRAKASSYASPRSSHPRSTSPPPPPSSSSAPHASSSSSSAPHTYTPSSSPLASSSSHQQPSSSRIRTQLPSPPPLSHKPSSFTNHKPQRQSFLTYFASTTPDSPSKRARLKTVFMLSGSGVYDAKTVLDRLLHEDGGATRGEGRGVDVESLLALECAILYGKLGNHAKALDALVRTLHDEASAEAYCILGGEVISAKSALAVAESTSSTSASSPTTTPSIGASAELSLKEWYFGLFEPQSGSGKAGRRGGADISAAAKGVEVGAPAVVRQRSVKDDVKKALLTDLVGAYMRSSDTGSGVERTTKLLNSQGVNLEVVDVITLVPDQWPLQSMHTFLTRYFRRSLHSSYEHLILKNLGEGQNLLVRDQSWPILREAGYVIEEPDSDDNQDFGDDEKAAHLQTEEVVEKFTIPVVSEKAPFESEPEERSQPEEAVVDVHIDEGEEQRERQVEVAAEEEEEEVLGEERSALGLILDGGAGDGVGEEEADAGTADAEAEGAGKERSEEETTEEEDDNFVYGTQVEGGSGEEERDEGRGEEEEEEEEEEAFVYEDLASAAPVEEQREEEEDSEGSDFVYGGDDVR